MTKRSLLISSGLILLAALLQAGCKTSPPPRSESLAFVEITNHTPIEVARAASETFKEAGYTTVTLPPNRDKGMMLMFQREAGTSDVVLFGDWSGNVIYRIKLNIKSIDPQTQLLECDAFRVLDPGDPRFEEEKKLTHMKRKPYQELLDRIKEKLNPGSVPK